MSLSYGTHIKERLRKEGGQLGAEFKERVASYLTAAFGLVAGLAWNDAIKALIDSLYPTASSSSLVVKFIYAIVITLVLVLVTIYVFRRLLNSGNKK